MFKTIFEIQCLYFSVTCRQCAKNSQSDFFFFFYLPVWTQYLFICSILSEIKLGFICFWSPHFISFHAGELKSKGAGLYIQCDRKKVGCSFYCIIKQFILCSTTQFIYITFFFLNNRFSVQNLLYNQWFIIIFMRH